MLLSTKKKFIYISIFIILVFLFLEIFSKFFVFFVTKNFLTFQYGFNKNIKIDINHLIKDEINIIDLRKLNKSLAANIDPSSNESKKRIWVFGGSTSRGNNCGDNSSSWTNELMKINKNLSILNYAANGIDSYRSLQILQSKIIEEKPYPESVVWGHKFNEINIIYQGIRNNPNNLTSFNKNYNKKFYLIILKTDHTLETNMLFYKILKNIIITTNRKFIRNIVKEHINPNLSVEDFKYAAKNFEINTIKAINLTKKIGVKKFYILSLPSSLLYENKMKNIFFPYYYEVVKKLINIENVEFIDLSKNDFFFKNEQELFCDEMHKTLLGNNSTAILINPYLK